MPGPSNLHPDKMCIPEKVTKALAALEEKNKKDPRNEPSETMAEYKARCEEESDAIQRIREKAVEDRKAVVALKMNTQGPDGRRTEAKEENKKRKKTGSEASKKVLVTSVNVMSDPDLAKLISGEMCIAPTSSATTWTAFYVLNIFARL